MNTETQKETKEMHLQAHPWHGVDPRGGLDGLVVFIENTPLSVIKYEVDHDTGLLKVDRPQDTAALPPAAYGFVPRTLCGAKVAQLNSRLRGDRAALDIYILSERPLEVPGVLAEVRVVGGIPVKDETFVDDKLIAVLCRDAVHGHITEITDIPVFALDRICHFLTHESNTTATEVGDPFGAARADVLLQAAFEDYQNRYPN